MDNYGTAQSGAKKIFLNAGKYTLAAFEYAALVSFEALKAGGSGVKRLVSAAKDPIAKFNPAPYLASAIKKIFKARTIKSADIENIKADLEQRMSMLEERLAMLEERLAALEQQRTYSQESIVSQKKAIEEEKLEILKQLDDINKSLVDINKSLKEE